MVIYPQAFQIPSFQRLIRVHSTPFHTAHSSETSEETFFYRNLRDDHAHLGGDVPNIRKSLKNRGDSKPQGEELLKPSAMDPKRQRDMEDSDGDNDNKRRRVEKENHDPVSPIANIPAQKPDTPALPSIQSRIQMLAEKATGTKQAHSAPLPPPSSRFVRSMRHQLQEADRPSSSQAAFIRQKRQEELNILNTIQPVAANAWQKGWSSDPASSQASRQPPPRRSRVPWPPQQHDLSMSFASSDGNLTLAPFDLSQEEIPPHHDTCPSDPLKVAVTSTPAEMSTSAMLDEIFKDVLEAAKLDEEEGEGEDVEKGEMERMEKEEKEEVKQEAEEGCKPDRAEDENEDELLKLPPSCVLSPLSESVEKVVTPLRLAAAASVSNRLSFQLTSEGLKTPPDTQPLYSIDAYRSKSRSDQKPMQSVTPWRRGPEKPRPQPQPCFNTKNKIKALKEEAAKLVTVISQTQQALNCCVDEQHGKGSVEEAEAERLLLISSEKREALLCEIGRLEGASQEEEGDPSTSSPQPCRGSISISEVHLPLKVDFVCSARNASRPSHFFFVLFRYGPENIMATPLATAADAKGDTISFSVLLSLRHVRPSFEIDVEVYSMSDTPNSQCDDSTQVHRKLTKQRVTPRKLLNTLKRSHQQANAPTPSGLGARRPSKFSLVGCHKITLASLGQSKFPLDKVPFLSPLEGHIHLSIQSEFHSEVEHHGFLTMFKDINGLGAWHRLFFKLTDTCLYYWNHPNVSDSKPAEGEIPLSHFKSQSVRPVRMDSCARPFTFELVSSTQQEEEDPASLNKRWFAADTQEERVVWMERLNQALVDLHTWTPPALDQDGVPPRGTQSSGSTRESTL